MTAHLNRRLEGLVASVVLTATTLCGQGNAAAAPVPVGSYDHVVLVVLENHEQSKVIGAHDAPYLTSLAARGANFTQSYAIQHPSQPNYLDLFSGSDQGVRTDACPHTFAGDNIGNQLIATGRTFVGYSEDLPAAGSTVCRAGNYARKHNPWSDFADLDQRTVNLPYSAFPTDFERLPTLSWVVPNLCNDMHNCAVSAGDRWARAHLDAYARWATTHNSLLIVTFDEDDGVGHNRIPTLFVGDHIKPGDHDEHIDHFTVLRTVEDIYRLDALGQAAQRNPITDIFGDVPSAVTGTH